MDQALNGRRVLSVVTSAVAVIARELQGEYAGRRGGLFCMGRSSVISGALTITYHQPVGPTLAKKRRRYNSPSLEKVYRLHRNPNHNSSWQSRKPDFDQWGGAIRAGEYIFSFSGLPELADEAVMLATAVMLLLLTLEEACAIARLSDNQYFLKIGVRAFLGRHPRAVEE